MMHAYLAIDIGASSGRHILGHLEDGKLKLEEIYRFENQLQQQNGALTWDIDHLTQEVVNGLKACKLAGKIPVSVAIDTWGVDYVLLDEQKKEIFPVYAYRDSRTRDIPKEVVTRISDRQLYEKTGIQKQDFNTVYQLYHDQKNGRLQKAAYMLFIPEYLSFKLTGCIKSEYTIASTSGLLHAKTRDWDQDLLLSLGFPPHLFRPLCMPGTVIGDFSREMQKEIGFQAKVVFCPSHDTASAVAACPLKENDLFLSSGTWSLIGCENAEPIVSTDAQNANFTNEGGIDGRYRFLKNIMGMWLFQNIRKDLKRKYSYDEMMHMAQESRFIKTVDVNAPDFVAPDSMIDAFRCVLKAPTLPVEDVLSFVYHSLASLYAASVCEIEKITGKTIANIHIVGGGSKDDYLNQLTAKYTGKPVYAGPVEATAAGNILSQLMQDDPNFDLDAARALIEDSFQIKEVIIE